MKSKQEKVAVVTGSAKGLGREIAIALAKKGYSIVVHYRKSKKEAEQILSLVKKVSKNSILVAGDLTLEKDVNRILKEVLKKFGQVDLLVNNVGDYLYKEFGKTTNKEFKNIIESNLYPPLFCSRAVLPAMRKAKTGYIINIGTVGAERLTLRSKSTPYFMAKNALYYLTKIMAWEEAKNGIHINMISPASLVTDIFNPDDFPMGRSAKYDDVIKIILFLISDAAYYINGSNIEVAGGFVPGM